MIYIIEDDQNVRDGFRLLLNSVGYDSMEFDNAEAFLTNYKSGINDLVILDIHLIGIDGLKLLEIMNKQKIHLPVIIVTAYDNQTARIAAKNYGALAYFRKPVDSKALIDAIRFNIKQNVNENN